MDWSHNEGGFPTEKYHEGSNGGKASEKKPRRVMLDRKMVDCNCNCNREGIL